MNVTKQRCPKCNSVNLAIERRWDGDTKCIDCNYKDKSFKFSTIKAKETMSDNEELKPCPFCGGNSDLNEMYCNGTWWIACGKCIASGPDAESRQESINAWNTRK